jgi:hypothetical protein
MRKFNTDMTIKKMKEIEPRLGEVESFVVIESLKSASKTKGSYIYWWQCWIECKKQQWELIGWEADKEELRNSDYWSMWHDHLMSLSHGML